MNADEVAAIRARAEAGKYPKPETPKRPVDDILADHTTQEDQQ